MLIVSFWIEAVRLVKTTLLGSFRGCLLSSSPVEVSFSVWSQCQYWCLSCSLYVCVKLFFFPINRNDSLNNQTSPASTFKSPHSKKKRFEAVFQGQPTYICHSSYTSTACFYRPHTVSLFNVEVLKDFQDSQIPCFTVDRKMTSSQGLCKAETAGANRFRLLHCVSPSLFLEQEFLYKLENGLVLIICQSYNYSACLLGHYKYVVFENVYIFRLIVSLCLRSCLSVRKIWRIVLNFSCDLQLI